MIEKKYFGTDGIRGKVGEYPITAEFVLKLGWALGKVLSDVRDRTVIIGKDTRISGYMFEAALEAGLSAAGANTRMLGPMPTPAIAYLTRTLRAQAGVVISASHNPYEDNGIKIFSEKGFKFPDEIELAIEAEIEKPMTTVSADRIGNVKRVIDAPGRYIEYCKSTISHDVTLNGLKIVVDCGHGATYHVAPNVFSELGADVIKLGVKPNGFNINSECGSTRPELLQKTVVEKNADLGIAFDGDGDRVIMVDHKGEVVDGDELIYIITSQLVKSGKLHGQGVVGTGMSNLALELAIKALGLEFVRTNVGDRYVLAEMLQRNWLIGGEPSGHIICLDFVTTGDGIISALQVLKALYTSGKSLYDARIELNKFPQKLINVRLKGNKNPLIHSSVESAIQEASAKLGTKGRVLIRASGTEPVIRVMVEGEDLHKVNVIATDLAGLIEQGSN